MFTGGDDGDDGDMQLIGQDLGRDCNALLLRHVKHVDYNHDGNIFLQQLLGEDQVAFEIAGI